MSRGAAQPRQPEREFQVQVITLARLCGWLAYHARPGRTINGWRTPVQGDPGFPDCIFVHARRRLVLYRELKSDRGRLNAEQIVWLAALAAAGQDAAVWRPAQWAEIERVLKGEQ